MIELRFLAFTLTKQARITIGCGLVCLVAALMSVEVVTWTVTIVFRFEGFHGGTGFQQGAINAEVFP